MTPPGRPGFVDPRAVRFGALLTGTLALAAAAFPSAWLAGAASVLLLASAAFGTRANAWSYVYRATLRRRLAPPSFLEPGAPPRFANLLGALVLAGAAVSDGVGAVAAGRTLAGLVAVLAYLNAFANWCLGCKLYGLLVRPRRSATSPSDYNGVGAGAVPPASPSLAK